MVKFDKKIKKQKTQNYDEEIESLSSGDDKRGDDTQDSYLSDDGETAQEKKHRLVKAYLAQMEKDKNDTVDDSGNRDTLLDSLNHDVLKQSGAYLKILSKKYYGSRPKNLVTRVNGHRLSPTCAIFSPDSQFIFSAAKDGRVIKWAVNGLRKIQVLHPRLQRASKCAAPQNYHTSQVLALSISSDGKYLVSGGLDLVIHVWNPENFEHIHAFTGHRAYITGLAFRHDTHQLFSSAHDRFIMIWDLDHKRNIDTLFGHKESITDVDCFVSERAISSGGCDSSVHLWKVVEESQLIYKVERSSIDRVRFINEEHFVTGNDDGEISIWHIAKKKPICTFKHATNKPNPKSKSANSHTNDITAIDEMSKSLVQPDILKSPKPKNGTFYNTQPGPYWIASLNSTNFSYEPKSLNGSSINPYWITALAVIPNSDVLATGSSDSYIRVWKLHDSYKKSSLIFELRMVGFINSLAFSPDERYLLAAVGKEHRLGRWKILPVQNCIALIDLLS